MFQLLLSLLQGGNQEDDFFSDSLLTVEQLVPWISLSPTLSLEKWWKPSPSLGLYLDEWYFLYSSSSSHSCSLIASFYHSRLPFYSCRLFSIWSASSSYFAQGLLALKCVMRKEDIFFPVILESIYLEDQLIISRGTGLFLKGKQITSFQGNIYSSQGFFGADIELLIIN